jgi:hypothetical protein
MAATDHLGTQFWPLTRVGQLQSGNEPGLTVEQEYQQKERRGEYTENDHARAAMYGQHPRDYQAQITQHVDQHGQLNPAQWEDYPGDGGPVLAEGYHRYAAHRNLGNVVMPVRRI